VFDNKASEQACVYIVGAGPGDPELLTVKALRLLKQADVIVYDRLVSQQILDLIPPGSTRIFVGKEPGRHHLSQDEINKLLASLAMKDRCVVRLKGGDPFVFGRGSEEALFLVQHGVSFEIVPGITASSACSSYAGIPLTHRGLSNGVRFVTGHCRSDMPLDLNWDKLADPEMTLVVYMGMANLPEICEKLIKAGLSSSTPVAAIENGTTPQQRKCISTLSDIQGDLAQQDFQSPVMIIVGKVVSLTDSLDWFSTRIQENKHQNSKYSKGA